MVANGRVNDPQSLAEVGDSLTLFDNAMLEDNAMLLVLKDVVRIGWIRARSLQGYI